MFINETRGIVNFVVDDDIKVFFRSVVRDFGVGDFFCFGHFDRIDRAAVGWYLEYERGGLGSGEMPVWTPLNW